MRNLGNCAILALAAGLSLTPGWGATWSPVNSGLPGVTLGVNALTIDPVNPSTIYARSTSIPNGGLTLNLGLFKTTDAGAHWTDVSSGLSVMSLVIDPKNSATLYAGTNQGVAKTTNGGANWNDVSTGLSGSVTSLAIDPVNPSTLYAVTNNNGAPFPPVAGAPVSTIFKSTNGGASWSALDTGIPPGGYVNLLVIDPANPANLYALVPSFGVPPAAGGLPIGGIFKSSDGGQTWRMLNPGFPSGLPVILLAIDHATPSTLYALVPIAGGAGPVTSVIFKSADGGGTWQMVNSDLAPGTSLSLFVIDPAAPSTFYAAGQTFMTNGPPAVGTFKSVDAGQHWIAINTGLPANYSITSLVPDPLTPSRLYAGFTGFNNRLGGPPNVTGVSDGGLVRSSDGGQTWNPTGGKLMGFDIRTLATNPLDADTLYAGGLGGVFKTIDGGANWNTSSVTAYTSSVVTDSRNPNLVYAQTGSANGCNSDSRLVLSSTDGGANWSDAVSPLNSGCILNATFPSVHAAPMAVDPSTLYLGEADANDGYSALLKSTDGGASWSAVWDWFTGLRGNVRAIAIDPAHPMTVYAGIDDSKGSNSGLFKSTDGGATWTDTSLTKSAVNLVLIDPSNTNVVYAATESVGFQHLFKSTDGGATWAAIEKGLDAVMGNRLITSTALLADPRNPTVLFLGTSSSGVFRSVDAGANWSPFNDGLTSLLVRALVIAPGPARTVYAGTASGVFKIVDQ